MRRAPLAAVLAAVALAEGGCAHAHFTSRVTTSEPAATIWLDGRPLQQGSRVWALGPPHDGQLLVVARDGRRVRSTVARRISPGTVLLGFYTLGACFILCWAYPEEIHVVLPPAAPALSWDDDVVLNPWLAPPDGWSEDLPPANGAGP